MNIFEWYMLFAITTSVVSLYELVHPVIKLRATNISPAKIENVTTMYITFLLIGVLIAPLVFLSCIIPSYSERFREHLYKGLFPEE